MTMTLQLVRGLPRIGTTANQNEANETIDLLNPDELTIDPDGGWVPGVGQAEARFGDQGDVLLAAPITRVTETMRLLVKASSPAARATLIQRLNQFARDAERLHIDQTFYQPVYLKWQPPGATKLQYALVYSINLSATADLVGMEDVDEWSLEIVREAGWRAVAPGGNPKIYWANDVARLPFGPGVTNVNINPRLYGYGDSIGVGDHQFRQFVSSVSIDQAGSDNLNYLTMPATNLVGDLPALLHLSLAEANNQGGGSAVNLGNTVMIGKWSRAVNLLTDTGAVREPLFNLSFSDYGTPGTDTVRAADAGASGVTAQRLVVTPTTTTLLSRYSVGLNNLSAPWYLFPGTYRVFLRARLSAAGTISVQLRFGSAFGTTIVGTLVPLSDTGTGGTGATGEWYLLDMGVFTLPQYGTAFMELLGTGLGFDEDLTMSIWAIRSSGTQLLYMSDVIFMPLDEGAVTLNSAGQILKAQPTTVSPSTLYTSYLYENTGHFNRGLDGESAFAIRPDTIAEALSVEGAPLTVTPGRENRFPMVIYTSSTRRTLVRNSTSVFGLWAHANVVPRWLGRRT
jgi:hypothetical protein